MEKKKKKKKIKIKIKIKKIATCRPAAAGKNLENKKPWHGVCIKRGASERPKGVFPLTAATVIRPQELCLIAAVTVTYGRKRIAAGRAYFSRKKLFRPQFSYGIATVRPLSAEICSFGQNLGDLKSILRPKEHISAERGLTILSQLRKGGGVAAATESLLRPKD